MSVDILQIKGLQICNYSAMAALAFTVYDLLITADDEVACMWKKPWKKRRLLYFWLRYFPFIAQLVSAVITLDLTAGNLKTSRSLCLGLIGFQACSSQAIVLSTQIVLILRVRAIYSRKLVLHRILYAMFITECVIVVAVVSVVLPHIGYGDHCVATTFPVLTIVYVLLPLLIETFLFSLTMYKFYQTLKEGWAHERVVTRFTKDGVWAFFLPFAITTVNSVCLVALDSALSTVAYSWQITIPGFAGYRLLLNLNHLLRPTQCTTVSDYTISVLTPATSPAQPETSQGSTHMFSGVPTLSPYVRPEAPTSGMDYTLEMQAMSPPASLPEASCSPGGLGSAA